MEASPAIAGADVKTALAVVAPIPAMKLRRFRSSVIARSLFCYAGGVSHPAVGWLRLSQTLIPTRDHIRNAVRDSFWH